MINFKNLLAQMDKGDNEKGRFQHFILVLLHHTDKTVEIYSKSADKN